MMIFDDFRFFDREGEASKKLENYGRYWWRIMRFGLSVIMSNIYYGCISVADSLIGSVTKRGGEIAEGGASWWKIKGAGK